MPLPLAVPIIASTIAGIAIPFFFPSKAEQEKEEIKQDVLSEIKINGFNNSNGTFQLEKKNAEPPQALKDFSNVVIIIAILFVAMLLVMK